MTSKHKHGMNNDEHGEPLWKKWFDPFSNRHAPSRWKKDQRRQEKRIARHALRNGREPEKYSRPYYW